MGITYAIKFKTSYELYRLIISFFGSIASLPNTYPGKKADFSGYALPTPLQPRIGYIGNPMKST